MELHRRAEAAKAAAAAEERRKAEEAAAEERRKAEELNQETEILSLATPISRSPATGAGPSVESFAKDKLEARMSKVHFCNTPDELKTAAATAMSTQRRVVVLVGGITTEKEAFGTMVDVAKQVWDQYAEGTGASPEAQSLFRIVVLLGSRWDLLDKVAKKAAALFPKWSKFKMQIETRDWQSRNFRPGDVFVMCPAEEVQRESTVIGVKFCKDALASEGIRLRCNEPECKWRSRSQGLTGPREDEADVHEDDKVDLLSAMLAEQAEAGEEDKGDGLGGVPAPGPEAEKVVTMLWPYGRSTGHYDKVLEAAGKSRKASAAVIISSTAHPCHWVACVQQGLDTYVFTRRWSNHGKHHGLALGKKILLDEILVELKSDFGANSKSQGSPFQFLRMTLPAGPQMIEAYDCHQGSSWHDGLNLVTPSKVLETQIAKLTATEQDQYNLSIAGSITEGCKLLTTKGLPPGGIACPVSSLFFDNWDALMSFLNLPGNAHFGSRVVQIQNVHRNKTPGTVWAVMVGVARFVEHFGRRRGSPNCVLHFDQTKGFNAGSLNLMASQRNGVGISPNSPLLLNFGADFDIDAARALASRDDGTFRGALDLLFASQKDYLKDDVAANEQLAKEEELHAKQQAEAAAAAAADKAKAEAEKSAAEAEKKGQTRCRNEGGRGAQEESSRWRGRK